MSRGSHSRGYLPHWDISRSIQAITFRLADSVPYKLIREWKSELESLNDRNEREKQLHRLIARYEDAGQGQAILAHPKCAECVQQQLIKGHGSTYELIEWVIMPNHVHVLIHLLADSSMTPVVKQWKGAAAREINLLMNRKGKLWAHDYYDRLIRDLDHLNDSISYIHRNPVKAGLCASPEQWKHSSAGTNWSVR